MAIPEPSTRSGPTADATIAPFLAPDFSPIAYFNSTLPAWTHSAAETTGLTDLAAQTQAHVGELDAKLARLASTLTQLTDDILRSGARLSYEVEILRADATGLDDAVSTGLKKEMARLVQGEPLVPPAAANPPSDAPLDRTTSHTGLPDATRPRQTPQYMQTLHTLSQVRKRLDSVTATFDAALKWPLAPSALSLRSQFVSVAGPAMSGASASPDVLEAMGKAWEERTRAEIADLIDEEVEGLEAAAGRVADLRALSTVWTGTVEEKPRLRFVEALERMLTEQRDRALGAA